MIKKNGIEDTVRLIVFPGAFNWPIWVGVEKNWFKENDINLELNYTASSIQQLTGLINHQYDLAITLIDNLVAYKNNCGAVPIHGKELIGLMACDTISLPNLICSPNIKSYSDLKNSLLCADALTTGYAFLLKALLDNAGLSEKDYQIISVGGVQQRFEEMIKLNYSGSLFNSPFEKILIDKGFNLLDNGSSVAKNYQGQVLAANESYVDKKSSTIKRFIKIFLKAVNWLYEFENFNESLLIFDKNQINLNAGYGPICYESLFHQSLGLPRDGKIQLAGVSTVIDIRNKYQKNQIFIPNDPENYVDMRLLEEVKRIL